MLLLFLACNPTKETTGQEIETDSATSDTTEECVSDMPSLPDYSLEISHDDGVGYSSIPEQSFSFGDIEFVTSPMYEATRFELSQPGYVYGFSIQYAQVPEDGQVFAGLYDDFGYNGFDFWQYEPLWQGSQCASDIEVGEWTTFVLDTPLEITHPQLIYVAHRREGVPDEPAWFFDSSVHPDNNCNEWDNCHSAWNFPENHEVVVDGVANYAYNGFSFPFTNDYLVRLHVEYFQEEAWEPVFTELSDVELAGRHAWGDFDNDGLEDIFASGKLLQNVGDGNFIDVSDSSGLLAMDLTASGGVWGDYNNDGYLDLFVFAESGDANDRLLQNVGNESFIDVTVESLIDDYQEENDCAGAGYVTRPTAGAAWFELDGDGYLDLYMANFICWSNFSFYKDTVWKNNGDGTFTELSGQDGFFSREFSGRGANPADIDNDGDIDLLVNNYTLHRNLLFINEGDSTVQESGRPSGLSGVDTGGYYGHTIGSAWGDLDNDGYLDVVLANLAHPRFFDFSDKSQIFMNNADGTFSDIQGDWSTPYGAAGLRYQETHSVPMLSDFNQDGNLDLVISAVYPGRPTDFYWGNGDGTFRLDAYHAGLNYRNGWGVSGADMDNDGDIDVAISKTLYKNQSQGGHWLQVRVVGNMGSNTAGIGATVRITAGDQQWIRHVNGGTGQGDQNSIITHFGIGEHTEIDLIEVRFPMRDWIVIDQSFAADQRLWVYEDGTVVEGWTP